MKQYRDRFFVNYCYPSRLRLRTVELFLLFCSAFLSTTLLCCWNVDIVFVVSATSTNPSGYQNRNPYKILDISPSASEKDVKRKYYQLCLKYHPDKLQQLPKQQRQKYEHMFKDIQWAYSEISSGNYRQTASFPFHSSNQRRTSTSTRASWNEYYRSLFEQQQYNRQYRTRPYRHDRTNHYRSFNVGKTNMGMSPNAFPFFNSNLWSTTASTTTNQSPKFLFRQHVTIPLSDLYMGQSQYQFKMSSRMNSILVRALAAFRGGMGLYLLYQSILYALPIVRFSKITSIATLMYMFQQQLYVCVPSLETINELLVADILPGYKETTRLIFTSDVIQIPNVEVHIIIKEEQHPIYHRINNDLYAKCTISTVHAKKGCTVYLPSLRSKNANIRVVSRRNQKAPSTEDEDSLQTISINVPPKTLSGDIMHLVGKGWPMRSKHARGRQQPQSTLSYGDLFVTINVKPEASAPKWKWKINK